MPTHLVPTAASPEPVIGTPSCSGGLAPVPWMTPLSLSLLVTAAVVLAVACFVLGRRAARVPDGSPA